MAHDTSICLNCGDNRAEEDDVLCGTCRNRTLIGGYVGDGR